jgi:hypothetical protein
MSMTTTATLQSPLIEIKEIGSLTPWIAPSLRFRNSKSGPNKRHKLLIAGLTLLSLIVIVNFETLSHTVENLMGPRKIGSTEAFGVVEVCVCVEEMQLNGDTKLRMICE